jgi:hypothetical protein
MEEAVGAQGVGVWPFGIDRGGAFADIVARGPLARFPTSSLFPCRLDSWPDTAPAGIRVRLFPNAASPTCPPPGGCGPAGPAAEGHPGLMNRSGQGESPR